MIVLAQGDTVQPAEFPAQWNIFGVGVAWEAVSIWAQISGERDLRTKVSIPSLDEYVKLLRATTEDALRLPRFTLSGCSVRSYHCSSV